MSTNKFRIFNIVDNTITVNISTINENFDCVVVQVWIMIFDPFKQLIGSDD